MGMRRQADELVVAMNRAAEAAAPEAKALLVDAVKKMSVQDAKGVLTGGDTAATEYFRRTTQAQLTSRFLPIVKKATDRAGLAQQYNSIAGKGAALGLVEEDQATVERYVTAKALDGLYLMIAEQEKAFRQNPLGASSDIVKKVFGALR
jgi:Asp/Glu/hydantoin racemase